MKALSPILLSLLLLSCASHPNQSEATATPAASTVDEPKFESLALGERLLFACNEFAKSGFDANRMAKILNGDAKPENLIEGSDFRSATYFKSATLENLIIRFEAKDNVQLSDLVKSFGESSRNLENKIPSVEFKNAPEPCDALSLSARIQNAKVEPTSLVWAVEMRKRFVP